MAVETHQHKASDFEQEMLGPKITADRFSLKRIWEQWATGVLSFAIIGLYALILILFSFISGIRSEQAAGKQRGFQNRAVACESVIIDNDRNFALSNNCMEDDVIHYYPPGICVQIGSPPPCGSKFKPSPYPDPPRVADKPGG